VLGIGKTKVFEKIRNKEIVSRREGRLRRIHVPSLIARYGLEIAPPEAPPMADETNTEAVVGRTDVRASTARPQPPKESERPSIAVRRKPL
jgi:hypothetical protein